MSKPNIVSAGSVRDRTDHEIEVINHVVRGNDTMVAGKIIPATLTGEQNWVEKGRFGIIDGQVEDAEKRMAESIIITARAKQMDPQAFLDACGARAQGLTVVGKLNDPSTLAVAHLLNNLEPAEANSLAGGTDVTDRAVIRAKNAATVSAVQHFDNALVGKVKNWEESHDKAKFDSAAINKPYQDRDSREAISWRSNNAHAHQIKRVPDVKTAKSILGTA